MPIFQHTSKEENAYTRSTQKRRANLTLLMFSRSIHHSSVFCTFGSCPGSPVSTLCTFLPALRFFLFFSLDSQAFRFPRVVCGIRAGGAAVFVVFIPWEKHLPAQLVGAWDIAFFPQPLCPPFLPQLLMVYSGYKLLFVPCRHQLSIAQSISFCLPSDSAQLIHTPPPQGSYPCTRRRSKRSRTRQFAQLPFRSSYRILLRLLHPNLHQPNIMPPLQIHSQMLPDLLHRRGILTFKYQSYHLRLPICPRAIHYFHFPVL